LTGRVISTFFGSTPGVVWVDAALAAVFAARKSAKSPSRMSAQSQPTRESEVV
jgi:hypothetical protein